MKVVFLYTEIASYFTACCEELSKDASVHVIRYPVNKEAPFHFEMETQVAFYNRFDYNLKALSELVSSINPDIIFCSGWIDKDYLRICRAFKNKIRTVLCMDTKWRGDFKQKIAQFLAPFTIKRSFSHVWVPGDKQKKYANKLGFGDKVIALNYYCADTSHFKNIYQKYCADKNDKFPHRFIYIGRYYDFKGVTDLWEAFISLQEEVPNDWELWCLGTGDLKPVEHPKIKHFGFVQPDKIEEYLKKTGVFVLPSRYEPWAVVVHEMAMAGFPLLLSSEVGASEKFLINDVNGYQFEARNVADLKEKMKNFILLPDESLNLMVSKSVELAQGLNTKIWARTALNFLK